MTEHALIMCREPGPRTMGHMYIKILDVIDRHGNASYYDFHAEILKPKGKPVGNDVELFRNLESQGLTELDHLGKYKRKFFRLTALGKLVLETAKKNQPAYRVLRHFNISRGKRRSMPQPKTRPDSPVPSLQGPCDRSLKSEVPCGSCLNWR